MKSMALATQKFIQGQKKEQLYRLWATRSNNIYAEISKS